MKDSELKKELECRMRSQRQDRTGAGCKDSGNDRSSGVRGIEPPFAKRRREHTVPAPGASQLVKPKTPLLGRRAGAYRPAPERGR